MQAVLDVLAALQVLNILATMCSCLTSLIFKQCVYTHWTCRLFSMLVVSAAMHHLVSYSQCKGVDHFHAEVPAVAPCSFPVFAGQSLKHHTFAFHRLISLEKCPTDTSKPWPFNCGPRGRMYSAGVRQRVSLPKIYGQATNESTNQLHLHILICGPISV